MTKQKYQGPVPKGYSERKFRNTGKTEKSLYTKSKEKSSEIANKAIKGVRSYLKNANISNFKMSYNSGNPLSFLKTKKIPVSVNQRPYAALFEKQKIEQIDLMRFKW